MAHPRRTPEPQWKYVNVRRLFIYIEQSIYECTQWAVFEPITTWARSGWAHSAE
jgi:phage tail sheath protein FI